MSSDKLVLARPLTIFLKGFLGGLIGLSGFYYLLLWGVTQDPGHPVEQFALLQPWMSVLLLGFGVQVGLFWLLKKGYRLNVKDSQDARFAAGAGTAVSGMAMVACCAHHLVDVLPILGFSAAALFLSEHQQELLMMGVFANAIGVGVMGWFLTGMSRPREIMNYIYVSLRRSV